ncbi:uncharacterized protein [Apostichopus japonicus]|uniref:uncharacterized protein n=1 Tax=Stichopus japonicus TaxID=307972 RepID=UPI003AB64671
MEILSDSSLKTFSSETISLDSSCDSSSKSNGSMSPPYTSGRELSPSSTPSKSAASSEHSKSETTPSYSTSRTYTDSISLTSGDSNDGTQGIISPESDFMRMCRQRLQTDNLSKSSESTHSVSSTRNSQQIEFCNRCIKTLNSDEKEGHKLSPEVHGSKPERAHNINPALIERLKMERLLHSMREVTSIPDKPPLQHCQICRRMQRDVHERGFIQDKVRHLKNKLTEEKYQKYLTEMDSISQIGRLAANLPKATDPPDEIWNKLMKR